MNDDAASRVREIVDRETRAWDTKDAELLLSVFHPDMVWPWPKLPSSHDPMEWTLQWGRYDRRRWLDGWQKLFDTHELVRNVRETRKVEVSEQGDGALAVVDIDTLWRDLEGEEMRWKGRVCKVYSKVGQEWKMTMHTGVLVYP
jgi:ketosteroid isomerase-like protein